MKNYSIKHYIKNGNININKMINDYKGYIISIIKNNSVKALSYEDEEEVVSDVFLTVWKNKNKIDKEKPLKNYIAGITKNLINIKLRETKHFELVVSLDKDIEDNLADINLIYEQNEILNAINEELNNMNLDDYKIFTKYYYFSKSIKDISNELGISESNVKVKLYRIRKKLKNKLTNRNIIYKVLLLVLLLGTITGTIFAKEIFNLIKTFFGTSTGVESAIKSGYISDTNMNYINKNEISLKIESVLMDDYNLDLMFNIQLNDINNNNVLYMEIPNLLITDENNNIILSKFENEDKYLEFCKNRGVQASYSNIGYSDGSESAIITNKNEKSFNYSYATHSQEFPKSKKLYLKFDKIIIKYTDENGKENNNIYNSNWELNIDLPEQFYNRETIIYHLKNVNMDDFKLISASVSNTGLKIEFETTWGQKLYNINDTQKLKEQKLFNWMDNGFDEVVAKGERPIHNDHIVNMKNKKFYPNGVYDGDGITIQETNGTLKYRQLYTLTNSEATPIIKLIFEVNNELLKRETEKVIEVELERK